MKPSRGATLMVDTTTWTDFDPLIGMSGAAQLARDPHPFAPHSRVGWLEGDGPSRVDGEGERVLHARGVRKPSLVIVRAVLLSVRIAQVRVLSHRRPCRGRPFHCPHIHGV